MNTKRITLILVATTGLLNTSTYPMKGKFPVVKVTIVNKRETPITYLIRRQDEEPGKWIRKNTVEPGESKIDSLHYSDFKKQYPILTVLDEDSMVIRATNSRNQRGYIPSGHSHSVIIDVGDEITYKR